MKVEEVKIVSVEQKTLTGYKCDSCGKVHGGHVYPSDWYHFLIINSWSTADDDDSFGDACSAECYLVEVDKGIKNDNQVSGMQPNFAKKNSCTFKFKVFMKIVKKLEFYKLPCGTLYSDYSPSYFNDLKIKLDTIFNGGNPVDFIYESLIGNVKAESSDDLFTMLHHTEKSGESMELDFYCSVRDGLYEEEQLFAIYEQKDISSFIEKLKTCKGL